MCGERVWNRSRGETGRSQWGGRWCGGHTLQQYPFKDSVAWIFLKKDEDDENKREQNCKRFVNKYVHIKSNLVTINVN